MDAMLRALNRFGLGARIGERATVADARGWLEAQLDGRAPDMEAGLGVPSVAEGSEAFSGLRRAQGARDQAALEQARRRIREVAVAEARAALGQRLVTERPYVERLVGFWSNHLCISVAAKPILAPLAGSYEREAIRPHVLGRFEDMVLASARHPAMLLYLDNAQSVGPGSQAGRRAGPGGQRRGLNENYARELMELHTLGVDGGYTQQDVQELARILTGWSTGGIGPAARGARGDGDLGFVFRPLTHEPGSKTLLGVRYDESGVREGESAIRALCRHPSTARFVATKLVRHFVADDPPAAAIDQVARVFASTSGDLREVAREMVRVDAAWAPETRKFRTPQDWLVAVFRAFRISEAQDGFAPLLMQLRQPLWGPAAPKGYGDMTQEWADPDSLMNRAELARTIATRVARAGLEPEQLLNVVDVGETDPLRTLLADGSIAAEERIALAIGGPAFQWR